MLKITTLTRTSSYCPSQWEGVTEDGRKVGISYRSGILTAYIEPLTGRRDGNMSERIFLAHLSPEVLDGSMEYDEMRSHLSEVAILPPSEIRSHQYLWENA